MGNGNGGISINPQPLDPGDEALYAVGEDIFKTSIKNGADFCKEIVGFASAGLGLYYALASFLLPKDFKPSGTVDFGIGEFGANTIAMLPPFALVLAIAAGALGLFAPVSSMDLTKLRSSAGAKDNTSITFVRNRIIEWRAFWSLVGTFCFVAGLLLMAITVFLMENNLTPEAEPAKPQYALVVRGDSGVSCGVLITDDMDGSVGLQASAGSEIMPISSASDVHLVDSCPMVEIPTPTP